MEIGKRGDADVLLVHARAREDAFVESGNGLIRYDVMYNDFVIIGPPDDPSKIKGVKSASDAFRMIGHSGQPFVSRGDNSGTSRCVFNVDAGKA